MKPRSKAERAGAIAMAVYLAVVVGLLVYLWVEGSPWADGGGQP